MKVTWVSCRLSRRNAASQSTVTQRLRKQLHTKPQSKAARRLLISQLLFQRDRGSCNCPRRKIIEAWQKENDGRALERLEEMIVRRIRTWRPDVVLTSQASPRGEAPLSHIMNQITLRAIESAADPTRFVEHTTHAGLESWQAKKVFTALPLGEMGSVSLSTSQLGSRIGKSLAQHAAPSRALLKINEQRRT